MSIILLKQFFLYIGDTLKIYSTCQKKKNIETRVRGLRSQIQHEKGSCISKVVISFGGNKIKN